MDCFVLDEPVTSLDMSPLGEYLVTTHVDNLGVYLWSNMTLYTHVNLRPLPENFEPHTIMLPSTHITSQGKPKEPKKVRFQLNTNALEPYGLFPMPGSDSDSDMDSCTMQDFSTGLDLDSDPLIEI